MYSLKDLTYMEFFPWLVVLAFSIFAANVPYNSVALNLQTFILPLTVCFGVLGLMKKSEGDERGNYSILSNQNFRTDPTTNLINLRHEIA